MTLNYLGAPLLTFDDFMTTAVLPNLQAAEGQRQVAKLFYAFYLVSERYLGPVLAIDEFDPLSGSLTLRPNYEALFHFSGLDDLIAKVEAHDE